MPPRAASRDDPRAPAHRADLRLDRGLSTSDTAPRRRAGRRPVLLRRPRRERGQRSRSTCSSPWPRSRSWPVIGRRSTAPAGPGRRWGVDGRPGRARRRVALWMDTWVLYPAALGIMVLSKSFGVLKAAVTPRVLPPGITLVTTNSRLTVFGLVASGVAGRSRPQIAWLIRSCSAASLTAVIYLRRRVALPGIPASGRPRRGQGPTTLLAIPSGADPGAAPMGRDLVAALSAETARSTAWPASSCCSQRFVVRREPGRAERPFDPARRGCGSPHPARASSSATSSGPDNARHHQILIIVGLLLALGAVVVGTSVAGLTPPARDHRAHGRDHGALLRCPGRRRPAQRADSRHRRSGGPDDPAAAVGVRPDALGVLLPPTSWIRSP